MQIVNYVWNPIKEFIQRQFSLSNVIAVASVAIKSAARFAVHAAVAVKKVFSNIGGSIADFTVNTFNDLKAGAVKLYNDFVSHFKSTKRDTYLIPIQIDRFRFYAPKVNNWATILQNRKVSSTFNLPNSRVTSFSVGNDDTTWIIDSDSNIYYIQADNILHKVVSPPSKVAFLDATRRTMAVIVGVNGLIYWWNADNKDWTLLPSKGLYFDENSKKFDAITSVAGGEDGSVWITTVMMPGRANIYSFDWTTYTWNAVNELIGSEVLKVSIGSAKDIAIVARERGSNRRTSISVLRTRSCSFDADEYA